MACSLPLDGCALTVTPGADEVRWTQALMREVGQEARRAVEGGVVQAAAHSLRAA